MPSTLTTFILYAALVFGCIGIAALAMHVPKVKR